MAYKLASAYVDIVARTAGLNTTFNQVQTALGQLFGIMKMNPLLSTVAGLGTMTFAMRQLMQESESGALAATRLDAVIRATGNAARISKEEVMDFAKSMQQSGTFGDTEIVGATAKLLQMRAVTKDTYKDVLKLSADLARSGFGSVEHAASTLGRALADPERGLMRLRSVGITFTKAEREKIAALAKSNKLLDAQKLILDKVRNSVGGLDEQFAKTPQGIWMQIKNDLASIGQELGDTIYPVIADLGRDFVALVRPVAKLVGYLFQINNALGGVPLKLILVGVAIKAAIGPMQMLYGLTMKNIAALLAFKAGFHKMMFGYLVPLSSDPKYSAFFVKMPGLLAKIGTAWRGLVAAFTTGTLLTGWGAILVLVGAILVTVVALGAYLLRFPKVNEAWNRTLKASQMFFEALWTAANELWTAVGSVIIAIVELTGEVKILKQLFEEGLPGAAVFSLDTITNSILRTTAFIKVLKSHLMDVAALMLAIAHRDAFALGAVLKNSKLATDALIEYANLAAQMNKMKAAGGLGGPDDATDMDLVDKAQNPLMGLQDAWKNVQESILKRASPEEKMADGIQGIEELNEKQLEQQVLTNRLLAAGGAVA